MGEVHVLIGRSPPGESPVTGCVLMAIGPRVRQWLGPLETPISDLYRGLFFNLDQFATTVHQWVPAEKILEVGCGEGAILDRLSRVYPGARLTGIDITSRVGRQFRGDRRRVTFHQQTIEMFSSTHSGQFDLVVICDVMHHIPWDMHKNFLQHVHEVLKPGGYLVLKDWEKLGNVIHPICHLTDRCLTGDRTRYGTEQTFKHLIQQVFGPLSIKQQQRFAPWPNNLAFLIRRDPASDIDF